MRSRSSATRCWKGAGVPSAGGLHRPGGTSAVAVAEPNFAKNLSAQTIRDTNIIEIEYRSKDPEAAVNVINAVVRVVPGIHGPNSQGVYRRADRAFSRNE